MAAVMTYTSLVTQVTEYLQRADATTIARIPDFIALAEEQIAREVKPMGFDTYVTSTMTVGQSVYAKPAFWRATISMTIGTGTTHDSHVPLLRRSYEFCRDAWPDPTAVDQPRFEADYGYQNWLIAPTPDYAYPWEIAYFARLQPLDTMNSTNWLTTYAPDAILFATLKEAWSYEKDATQFGLWSSRYDRSIQGLMAEDKGRAVTRDETAGTGA